MHMVQVVVEVHLVVGFTELLVELVDMQQELTL
jgi:hypothetical protein